MIKLWFASLANRAVDLVVAFVLVTAVVVASIGSALSRAELEHQAHQQVEAIVEMVARDLDQKLALRRDVLSHVASEIPASEALLQNRARVILRQQASLLRLFDALFIMDAEGKLLAANPLDYLIPSFNASERPYFKAVSS
ncbi:cache domain-containing protein [Marinobacter sp. NSM]|uniref:cache domain-containing protein n=1 Tax=Marinobacter sp. NSM TaxID=3458004 RepID=UPI00403622DA